MKVMSAIERCRTAALGGHVARCENDACGHTVIAYNSCRNRHCPKCQGAAAHANGSPSARPSCCPCPTSTSSTRCRRRSPTSPTRTRRVVYESCSRPRPRRRSTIAADPKRPRRQDRHHRRAAHLGLGDDASSARAHDRAGRRSVGGRHSAGSRARPDFFLPVRVLARLFRGKFLAMLIEAHAPAACSSSASRRRSPTAAAFQRFLGAAQALEMGRLLQSAVRRARGRARYLSRYTHRVAISNRRLIAADNGGVTFRGRTIASKAPAAARR